MKTIVTHGVDEFLEHADAWDFLWTVSPQSHPFSRSNSLSSAVAQFFPNDELKVVFVFDTNDEPLAALPLVQRTFMGLPVLELPNNEWGVWGDLLINPANKSEHVLLEVAKGVQSLNHFSVRLNLIEASSERWCCLLSQLKSLRKHVVLRDAFAVGMIEHDTSWTDFRNRLPKGLKKKLSKYGRRLSAIGEVAFDVAHQFDAHEIESVLNRIFDIECRSWKGFKETTTTDHNLARFFIEQAQCLNQNKALCVSFLKLDGADIAFEFGMISNRTYYSFKIGFDSSYDGCSPGHLLSEFLTEHFHTENICDTQDTMGPISQATSRWSSRLKKLSNVTAGGNIPGANLVLKGAYSIRGLLTGDTPNVVNLKLGTQPPGSLPTNAQPDSRKQRDRKSQDSIA